MHIESVFCRASNKLVSAKESKTRAYVRSWENSHKWLLYKPDKNLMFCSLCLNHGKVNSFTTGTNNFKTTTIERHVQSRLHQNAVQEKKGKQDMKKTLTAAQSSKEQSVIKALQTVYYMAKTDIANNKYQETLEWLAFMGVEDLAHIGSGKNATYTSHHILEDMQKSITSVITEGINEKIQESPFITFLVDESTDIAVLKKLCIYIRILNINTMSAETIFLENIEVAAADATSIYNEITSVMAQRNIEMRKVIGLGSDGASVSYFKTKI